jgi:hypothetical protein
MRTVQYNNPMEHKENILRLRQEGKSYREIQKILGCSKGTIAYHLGEGQKKKALSRSNIGKALRRRELWKIKEDSGCVDCGEKYPHFMLHFDHKPEFKKLGSVGELYSRWGKEKGLAEMAKCDIVCANCHAIRTYNRNQNNIREV